MSTSTKSEQVIREIDEHIKKRGGGYSDWYAGVTANPSDRLFNGHNVDEKRDAWIFRDCSTDTVARSVEKHFFALGCDGAPGGGDENSRYAYAYKKSHDTNP